jgi:hypothetical protein
MKKSVSLRSEHKDPDGGLTEAGRKYYNRKTGSNLKPPAPNPKTKKDVNRRKSFCARSEGQMKMWPDAAKDSNSRLRKARKAWKC